jgi:hypothetical protein
VYISLITALVTLLITYQSQLLFLDDDNEVVEEWSRERRKVEEEQENLFQTDLVSADATR